MAMEFIVLEQTPDRIVQTKRLFKAPVGVVYEACTNPLHLKNWWGPNGFTNTFKEFDFRPGGKWDFIMHGPDKKDYDNLSEFIKTDPDFVAFNHISPPEFHIQMSFEEKENVGAELAFTMVFETTEACNNLKGFVTGKNEENMDRLEAEIESMLNPK